MKISTEEIVYQPRYLLGLEDAPERWGIASRFEDQTYDTFNEAYSAGKKFTELNDIPFRNLFIAQIRTKSFFVGL